MNLAVWSESHKMVWAGRDTKDHLVPTPLPWAGTPSTRLGHSKPHPVWPMVLHSRYEQEHFAPSTECLIGELFFQWKAIFVVQSIQGEEAQKKRVTASFSTAQHI